MINVLVYALPNRSGGTLSVIENLYYDFKIHANKYPDIHWFFVMGIDALSDTNNITILNEEWALKSWAHRYYYNKIKLRRFLKEKNVMAIISINMRAIGTEVPSIISFHNVLPFYSCNGEIFDDLYWMFKQRIINWEIMNSVKKAEYIIVPSRWVKETLAAKYGVQSARIFVSPIGVPEIQKLVRDSNSGPETIASERHEFIYPASGFPYKNHRVIVEATKILKGKGIKNYRVRFSGVTSAGKTIRDIKSDIATNHLPIEFCGNLSKKELVIAYRNSTLLFPSKIETDGFPLIESMACGGFILAADLPYAREALENYGNCKWFDPQNAEQLASLMHETIENGRCQDNPIKCRSARPRSEFIVPMIRRIVDDERYK